ncbi:MAG: monovalent cation/H+ antiporter subunit D [Rudaea sp.]
MNHWIVVPVVLPALVAAALIVLPGRIAWQRALGLVATIALLGTTIALARYAAGGDYATYALGDWPPPFGIVLVLDRLSALMLLLTAVIATASLLYARNGLDARGRHFHALFQFQLMGLNGAFLAGDLFNLFVFFEVLLIASYGLLLHAGGGERLRAGIHYVVLNLTGSALFLIAVSLLYALTGTLNMADMARAVAAADPADAALIRAGGLLLFVVFALKAAVVPLGFWLPATYAAATGPVAALFAIMTKLGVYAILRVATLVFAPVAGGAVEPWLVGAAITTLALATLGTLAARTLRGLIGYCTIASVGTLLAGMAGFSAAAIAAVLYYLLHSTLVIALLFLLADLVARARGAAGDRLHPARAPSRRALLGALFFVAAVGVAGVPPLSGFLGKVLLLEATQGAPAAAWIWIALLVNALATLVALSRAGSTLFWKTAKDSDPSARSPATTRETAPAMALVGCLAALTIAAAATTAYTRAAAEQLLDPSRYVEAVLGHGDGGPASRGARR